MHALGDLNLVLPLPWQVQLVTYKGGHHSSMHIYKYPDTDQTSTDIYMHAYKVPNTYDVN